ncbi:hypothetical protein [Methylobacterium sp. UNC300MFChir4.1]|uniref:hypothetical protein n=2 Tax=unclassified Methylobacterium TaxID=2615210 RepID=UPI001FCD2B87|nr:hypothetical protein [Methylobacterium sp. UNC300MFChir4.1]
MTWDVTLDVRGHTTATRRGDIDDGMGWRRPEPQARADLLMERLFIILAILVFAVAIVAVAAMAARGRREPLRMGSELDIEDEDLVIGSVGPRKSPIDRSAQVLDPRVLDLDAIELEPIRALDRTQRDAALRGDPPGAGR